MSASRHNSLEPLAIANWRWQPFLDHACNALQAFALEPYPIEEQFLLQTSSTGSKSKPIQVTTATWACRTPKLRQVRAACVEAGSAASVLNFVINPSINFDLPFFWCGPGDPSCWAFTGPRSATSAENRCPPHRSGLEPSHTNF